MTESTIVPAEMIASSIVVLRGQKVILDTDLASLYGVETKVFNQAVRRNLDRFPADFMFQLTPDEAKSLRSQFVTSNQRGGRRYIPFAFTEHGAVMAATILNSPRAVEVSVYVVRAFVKLWSIFAVHGELADRLNELEGRVEGHDKSITLLIEAIRQLALPPETSDRKIGFDEDR